MNIRLLAVVLFFSLTASCHKETLPVSSSANPACFGTHPVVRQVEHLKGRVGHRQDVAMYTIVYHVPGTIDSQWTGLVCNLPADYQVVGKEISFSGEYRSTSGKVSSDLGGEEMYYLFLTSIN